jgi:hypothetical protein
MLVWGGWMLSSKMYNSGARYCASASPDFNINLSPSSLNLKQGTSGNSTVSVNALNGFSGSVTLGCTGQPSGITCSFQTNPLASGSSTSLTMTAASGTATGTYNFQVNGVSGGMTRSAALQVTVQSASGPVLATLQLNPSTVVGSVSSQGTVTLSAAAPAGGIVIVLSSSNTAAASVPPSITVAAGTTSKTFTVTTYPRYNSTTATPSIFASYNGVVKSQVLTIKPDTITIPVAKYQSSTRRLTVQATSNGPSPALSVYVTSTGAFLGSLQSAGNGTYSGTFSVSKNPGNITVRSNLGGSASKKVTR